MKIILTGGSGDLGFTLVPLLKAAGHTPIVFDIRPPRVNTAVYHPGSILDRAALAQAMAGVDMVIHIAAWHGIHLVRGQRDVFDFWELNVTGTFLVLETAVRAGVPHFIHISSTSVEDWPDVYGSSKLLGEELVRTYAARHRLNTLILRPGAFIPYWNREVYANFLEWVRWFWRGAVHINDVAQAVMLAVAALPQTHFDVPPSLVVDGRPAYSNSACEHWDADGPGTTFSQSFPEYVDLAHRYQLDTTQRPKNRDMADTHRILNYQPQYGLPQLLQQLAIFGEEGPPDPPGLM